MKNITNSLNIIYLCTAEKGPSGGAKTIYNHSELINRLNIPKVTSEISHIKKRKIIFNKLKISKNKNIVLFFNDPFEINLINKIISYFKKKYKKIYLILINTPNINLFEKKTFFIRKKKVFLNKRKNIFILETKD